MIVVSRKNRYTVQLRNKSGKTLDDLALRAPENWWIKDVTKGVPEVVASRKYPYPYPWKKYPYTRRIKDEKYSPQ